MRLIHFTLSSRHPFSCCCCCCPFVIFPQLLQPHFSEPRVLRLPICEFFLRACTHSSGLTRHSFSLANICASCSPDICSHYLQLAFDHHSLLLLVSCSCYELVVCHCSVHVHVDHWLPLELPFRFEKKRRQPKNNFQCGVDEAVFNLTGKFSVLLVSVLERLDKTSILTMGLDFVKDDDPDIAVRVVINMIDQWC
jgi:hypothetical protein